MNEYYVIGGVVIALVLLAVVVVMWLASKFFFRFIKHILIILLIGAVGSGIYIYRMIPRKDPAIGKHAYLTENGKYLGVVEGKGEDNRRGEVWVVRPPGRYPVMYSKSRVSLKDRRDPKDDPKPSESPSSSPKPGKTSGRKAAPAGSAARK